MVDNSDYKTFTCVDTWHTSNSRINCFINSFTCFLILIFDYWENVYIPFHIDNKQDKIQGCISIVVDSR